MKNFIFFLLALTVLVSCSDSSNNNVGNSISISSGISQTMVKSKISKSGNYIQSSDYADSIKITDFKMLISRVKFHGSISPSEDTLFDDANSKTFATGAFVVHSDTNIASSLVASASIPSGTYNKVKIEMHRLSSNDLSFYQNKPYFADFTNSDRNTIAVRGAYYQNGVANNFIFFSDVVLNYTFNLKPVFVISDTGVQNFAFTFDPTIMFREDSGDLLVPSINNNKSKIEKNIKNCMKFIKK
jgi:hypothetical protein